jgi:hypothetical protein
MNERVRELALQARVQDRGYFIYQYGGPTGHQSVEKAIDLEKFAELIVRECLELTLGKDRKQLLDKGDLNGANLLQKDIVRVIKHFGVEE